MATDIQIERQIKKDTVLKGWQKHIDDAKAAGKEPNMSKFVSEWEGEYEGKPFTTNISSLRTWLGKTARTTAKESFGNSSVKPKQAVSSLYAQFEEWYAQECEAKKPAAYDAWLSENQDAIEQRALEKVRAELAAERAKMLGNSTSDEGA